MSDCPRCLDLEVELARLKRIAGSAGLEITYSPRPNETLDVDREIQRWTAAHQRADGAAGYRAGWNRAWSIAQQHLHEHRQRWSGQSREIAALRSRLGVVLMDLERLKDRG